VVLSLIPNTIANSSLMGVKKSLHATPVKTWGVNLVTGQTNVRCILCECSVNQMKDYLHLQTGSYPDDVCASNTLLFRIPSFLRCHF
jgi:hypothetical protein